MSAIKRLLLGRPIASEQAQHQLLPKLLALPVFASDALSSNAYATEEILHVLEEAGHSALSVSIPIAIAVGTLLLIVVTSYRQTVMAYPRGGGSYIVSKENLGVTAGLLAASALLIDYILTVAVSMAAGAIAVTSLVPALLEQRVLLAVLFIVFITIMNLRGAKESGTAFAIPTYAFFFSVMVMLVIGIARCTVGTCPSIVVPDPIEPEHIRTLSLFLILRAFSSGSTALTGVEAIADGVAAFQGKRPIDQARNASTTLGMLAGMTISMFIGITFLANRMGAAPSETRSVLAQIGHATFGGGFGFAFLQIATALILILAANTAYQDFPRLASILAKDRFMPRQFISRGDRLVFSNGIFLLALFAGLLIFAFNAELNRLIQLYVVGVFTSFTLSQAGMVMRWRRGREPGWKRRATINAIGATTTGIVLLVVAVTKFPKGAWMVIVAIPLLVLLLRSIGNHYASVRAQLRIPEERPRELSGTRAVVLVARVDEATMRALGYALALRPLEIRAIHVGRGDEARLVSAAWEERRISVPLEVIDGDRHNIVGPVRSYIHGIDLADDEIVTVIMPEVFDRRGLRGLISRRRTILIKTALLFEPRVVLTNVPVPQARNWSTARGAVTPSRTVALVLVSAVHNATLRAVEYARSLSPTDLRAVIFNVSLEDTESVLADWMEQVRDVPLEAVDSPYRELTRPLLRYIRQIHRQMPDAVVSVILPEFVVRRIPHQILHNQSAFAIKASLQFEENVVLTSVPTHLR